MNHIPARELEAMINHFPLGSDIGITFTDLTNATTYAAGEITEMLALPGGVDPYSASVRSVWKRGFHAVPPPAATNWRIMAQFIRLAEEIAEFTESNLWEPRSDKTRDEIADVLIVLAQLAWLTGMEPSQLAARPKIASSTVETEPHKRNLVIVLGTLARALRKVSEDKSAVHAAIGLLAQQMHHRCVTAGFKNIETIIVEKCAADEGRGKLHGAA